MYSAELPLKRIRSAALSVPFRVAKHPTPWRSNCTQNSDLLDRLEFNAYMKLSVP